MLLSYIVNINGRFTFINDKYNSASSLILVKSALPWSKASTIPIFFITSFRVMSKSKVNFGNDKATFVGVILPTHSVILTD